MHQCQLQMEDRDRERQAPLPKKRGVAASFPKGEVRFCVGQVCRHTKYNYTCVVYGWDPVCTASQSWISHMGVDKLRERDQQPFYNVLVGDGSQRYAAQENLAGLEQACPVPHPEVMDNLFMVKSPHLYNLFMVKSPHLYNLFMVK